MQATAHNTFARYIFLSIRYRKKISTVFLS